ncbi:MAG TPA: glycosyltransferase, partial [Gemmatimonadaceae bacterium]
MTTDSDARRLLVISYHFPPDGAIGGQRWAGLSKYLARLGWEVHVVTAAAAGSEEPIANVHRHFRGRRRTLNDFYRTAAGRFRQRSGNDQDLLLESHSRQRSISLLNPIDAVRKILGSAIFLPDDARGWIMAAAGTARALLRESKFDAVISSGPPHSAHLAALAATIGSDTPLWMDMRDPWSVTHRFGMPHDRLARAERFVLRQLES